MHYATRCGPAAAIRQIPSRVVAVYITGLLSTLTGSPSWVCMITRLGVNNGAKVEIVRPASKISGSLLRPAQSHRSTSSSTFRNRHSTPPYQRFTTMETSCDASHLKCGWRKLARTNSGWPLIAPSKASLLGAN